MKKTLFLTAAAFILSGGCGPMNTKPADSKAVQNNQSCGSNDETAPKVSYAPKKPFLILAQLRANADLDANAPQVLPQQGLNQYIVKLIHLQDPRKTSEILITSATYKNTLKPNAHTYPATVEKQSDGTYLVSLTFTSKRAALFEISFNLADGTIKDTETLNVNLGNRTPEPTTPATTPPAPTIDPGPTTPGTPNPAPTDG